MEGGNEARECLCEFLYSNAIRIKVNMLKNSFRAGLVLLMVCLLVAVSYGVQLQSAASNPSTRSAYDVEVEMHAPNSYFMGLIYSSSAVTSSNTTLFAPFTYNPENFSVTGKFVSFSYFSDASVGEGVLIRHFEILTGKNENAQSAMFTSIIVSDGENDSFVAGIRGSLFYAYSDNTLLLIHDSPFSMIQVYTYASGASIYAVLPEGYTPFSSSTTRTGIPVPGAPPGGMSSTISMMFNSSIVSGYLTSNDAILNVSPLITGGYAMRSLLQEHSYLNIFSMPVGNSTLSSVMSLVGQGFADNTVSYYAAMSVQNGSPEMDAYIYNNAISVTGEFVTRDNISLTMSSSSAVSSLVILLVNSSIINTGSSNVTVRINNQLVANFTSLASMVVSPHGENTEANVSSIGKYTVIAAYSPVGMHSLTVSVPLRTSAVKSSDYILPAFAAVAVVLVAAGILIRRKRQLD